MKVKIKYGERQLNVDFGSSVPFTRDEAIETAKDLYRMVADKSVPSTEPSEHFQYIQAEVKDKQGQAEKDTFNIRERIPNTVVDVAQLDVKQAITENALVRCPHCGQGHALIVTSQASMYLMRKNNIKNEFEIVANFPKDKILDYTMKDVSCQDYYTALQDMKEIEGDFAVSNDTEIFCPMCCTSESFLNWKDAYENPLHFFEYEEVCDICGGEVSCGITKDKSDGRYCNRCGMRG